MFPKRKFYFFPDGWEDLGEVEGRYAGTNRSIYQAHAFCMTILHIGKEREEIFKFCPKCKIKTSNLPV